MTLNLYKALFLEVIHLYFYRSISFVFLYHYKVLQD
jgi:hypothetical protein